MGREESGSQGKKLSEPQEDKDWGLWRRHMERASRKDRGGGLREGGHGVHSSRECTPPWAMGTITTATFSSQTRETEALKG